MGHYDSTVYNDNLAVSAELNSTLTPIIPKLVASIMHT